MKPVPQNPTEKRLVPIGTLTSLAATPASWSFDPGPSPSYFKQNLAGTWQKEGLAVGDGLGVKVLRVGLKLKEKDSTGLPRNVDCSRTRFHVDKLHLPAATWICFKG